MYIAVFFFSQAFFFSLKESRAFFVAERKGTGNNRNAVVTSEGARWKGVRNRRGSFFQSVDEWISM